MLSRKNGAERNYNKSIFFANFFSEKKSFFVTLHITADKIWTKV
jgi:hypothetical protein